MIGARAPLSAQSWGIALDGATTGGDRGETLRMDVLPPSMIDRCGTALRRLTSIASAQSTVIAVASPGRRDGRSTVAAGLALWIARETDQRTLLLDLDFAHPGQAEIFGVTSAPGLAEFVSSEEALRGIGDADGRLWLLPAGVRTNQAPPGLLQRLRADDAYHACRERFAWTIVDLPPLLDSNEVVRWCDAADACVLVARYRSTPMPGLERAAHMLRGAGTTGVVVTADSGIPEWVRRRM
ncbi:MAG TPA: CpsD/CapB family tyrosine-protein kinase [Candidatus Dormibacteraeota bacterium]|nr:CpsD/CapB family tyrosine-protein kinase [Candidatus Dormibacteraeota bacterium]